MRRKGWVAVAIGAAAVLAATQGSRAGGHSGDDGRPHRVCSLATLRGATVIGVILRTYDGEGQFTQVNNEKGSVSGNGPVDREASGTYQVNEDCTGSHELVIPGVPNPVTDRFVIVDRGREVRHFVVNPALVMVTGVSQKIDAR
jgi:hypothetical protein